jgi:hypothetical protein
VATRAYRLPAKYVIHAVGPIWRGGTHGERELLASCYRSSLRLAAKLGCCSIAFPLISAGIYGYPKREALEVARHEVQAFLRNHEMDIKLVLFDADAVSLADDLQLRVQHYIDDVYVGTHAHRLARQRWEMDELYGSSLHDAIPKESASVPMGDYSVDDFSMPDAPGAAFHHHSMPTYGAAPAEAAPRTSAAPRSSASRPSINLPSGLRSMLAHMDKGFSGTLLDLIDERGLKDSEVYKRANMSRQHFSKIRSNPAYQPKKQTVLALAVALELPLDQTRLLLERAGFALTHADKRDVIVEYFLARGEYDIYEINRTLYAFDQPLLG